MKLFKVRHFVQATLLFMFCGIFSVFALETLDLADIQKKVLENNLDLKIAYEKYYQAQKNVSVARGEFLPGLSSEMIRSRSAYAVAEAILPTPSTWFHYKGSKRLKIAESFARETITLNIFEGIVKNFYETKLNEKVLVYLTEELLLREKLVDKLAAEVELGNGDLEIFFNAKRLYLQTKQKINNIEALIAGSKSALNIAMALSPAYEYTLGEIDEIDASFVPENSLQAQEMAVANAPELKQNHYLYQAAKYEVKAATWSFVSFEGIGFEYAAVRKIEKSKARVILLKSQQIEDKIRNQVHFALRDLELHGKKIALNEEVLPKLENDFVDMLELYEGGQIKLNKFVEAEIALLQARRTLTELRYAEYVKLSQIKRLLGLNSAVSAPDPQDLLVDISTKVKGQGSKTKYYVSLTGDLEKISHVKYTIPELGKEKETSNLKRSFRFKFKAKRADYTGKAEITLLDGTVFVTEFKL